MVIVGRRRVRPSRRFQTVKAIEKAKEAGDEERVDELRQRYDVNADELGEVTVKQIFSEGGWVRSQLPAPRARHRWRTSRPDAPAGTVRAHLIRSVLHPARP
jgi:hypothetical protein